MCVLTDVLARCRLHVAPVQMSSCLKNPPKMSGLRLAFYNSMSVPSDAVASAMLSPIASLGDSQLPPWPPNTRPQGSSCFESLTLIRSSRRACRWRRLARREDTARRWRWSRPCNCRRASTRVHMARWNGRRRRRRGPSSLRVALWYGDYEFPRTEGG